jgi:flagellin-like hook-associated protein FlgL
MNISGFGGFDAASSAATDLRARVAELTRQVSSGQRAESYAGLRTEAFRAIDLRADHARRQAFSAAAERGGAFGDAAQLALKGISGAATRVMEHAGRLMANGMPGSDAQAVAQTAQEARTALQEIVGLLGERFAGEAIFGGADPAGAPVVSPQGFESTGLFLGIRAAVQGLGGGNGQAVLDQTLMLAQSNDPAISPFTGFAARAAQGVEQDSRRGVPVAEGVNVEIGLYAYRNAAVTSRGDTTGSWARDLIHGLSVIASLGPDQVAQGADYDALVRGAVGALKAGIEGVTEEQGALGSQQARLSAAAKRNEELATQLDLQLGKIEEVDMAEVITRLQSMQTQLEASYRALAMLSDLSLTNFVR